MNRLPRVTNINDFKVGMKYIILDAPYYQYSNTNDQYYENRLTGSDYNPEEDEPLEELVQDPPYTGRLLEVLNPGRTDSQLRFNNVSTLPSPNTTLTIPFNSSTATFYKSKETIKKEKGITGSVSPLLVDKLAQAKQLPPDVANAIKKFGGKKKGKITRRKTNTKKTSKSRR